MLKLFAARRGTTRKNTKNKRTRERVTRIESLEIRSLLAVLPWGPMQGETPNYYGPEPNWAYSPQPTVDPGTGNLTGGIHKFVDSLAGLGPANANNLGQYISIAVADTTTYPGSDYYEIALVQYTEKMHRDLNPTTLRGYVQLETPVNAGPSSQHIQLFYPDGTAIDRDLNTPGVQSVYAYDEPHYLGASIVATKDVPVRVKFTNYLPTGEGGDLFLPVDTTVMGSGMGPHMVMPMMVEPTMDMMDDPRLVQVTTMDPHNLVAQTPIILEGFTPLAYNGEFRVASVIDANNFVVMLKQDPGGPAVALGHGMESYTDSRGTLHLHGGLVPWVSDGTQHQWITPAGEFTNYDRGASAQNVPDMPDPGDGSMTFFWPNQQSSRLMFYHDHAFGITRLNVYGGEAAGYVLTDAVEQDLIARGIIPGIGIPLVIQDKTFIDPTTILTTDPTWPIQLDDARSDLWLPHVYMPNQNPNVLDAVNPIGRWDYGPWIWPPFPVDHLPLYNVTTILVNNGGSGYSYLAPPEVIISPPVGGIVRTPAIAQAVVDPITGSVTAINVINGGSYEGEPTVTIAPPAAGTTATAVITETFATPNVPDVSMVAEAFMDTSIVNGTAYPYLEVDPTAVRFRVLNAADDRFYNLQFQQATSIISSITLTGGGSGYTRAPQVVITDGGGTGTGAQATATIDPVTHQVIGVNLRVVGSGYANPQVTFVGGLGPGGTSATATAQVYGLASGEDKEVGMVPFTSFQPDGTEWPAGWPTPDQRDGGIPDPNKRGPQIIQIGTEGGFLPTPVVFDNVPIGWDRDPRSTTVGNVLEHNVFLGNAERADVIVDFSQFAGQTLILYTDSPAPAPAGDPRVDYYTGNLDQTDSGGNVSTLPGYGPNTRTLMQIRVRGVPGQQYPAYDMKNLMDAFATTPADSTGGGATAEATIVAGQVTGITVTNGGGGYTVAPIVTIVPAAGDMGTGATATVHIVNGAVQSITVTNPGSGYLAVPGVTINAAGAQQSVFVRGSDPIIVPQVDYNSAYGVTDFPSLTTAYERIQSTSLTFQPLDLSTPALGDRTAQAATINNQNKAIIEEWATDWGRIRTFLGVEVPFTNALNQTSLWFTVEDPVTEIVTDSGDIMSPIGALGDGTQIWKITHNGVDTHAIHFHLFNVQVINRVDWVGVIKPPEPNELGWKETVRMNPLEDIIVALRPVAPKQPFGIPDSIRLLDPTMPQGATGTFKGWDANGAPVTVTNQVYNFGWEYVWHCHILSHEEMDMMRPIQFNVARELPVAPVLIGTLDLLNQMDLSWTDGTPVNLATGEVIAPNFLGNPANEVGYRIERALIQPDGQPGTFIKLASIPANTTQFIDNTLVAGVRYRYRVVVFNAAGEVASNEVSNGNAPFVISYSLDVDSGVSPADKITSDNTPALTFVFNEAVLGTDAAVSVTDPNGGAVTPLTIAGWGTNTLSIAFTTGLTVQGQYVVRLDGTTPGIAITDSTLPVPARLNDGADELRYFTIDAAIPTADVVDVTPDPRADGVGSIMIVFSEAVYGLDLTDLTLTRFGGANLLTGAETLSTADNITWTLGNLTGITQPVGVYILTLTAAGSGITDAAGNALAAGASDNWTVNPFVFSGTAGADTFAFIAAGAVGGLPTLHQLRVTLAGSPLATYLYDATGSVSLTIDAGGGSDRITVTGGPGVDASTINRYLVAHTGPGAPGAPGYYGVSASNVEIIVDNAGAAPLGAGQRVVFNDGPANGDRFSASVQSRTGSMLSAAAIGPADPGYYSNSAAGYDEIVGAAPNGGTGDTASLFDSNGKDLFKFTGDDGTGAPMSSLQWLSGGTVTPALVKAGAGFETVTGYSTPGGADEAILSGSTGNDSVNFQPAASPPQAYITVPGSYFVSARNFGNVKAYPGASGIDTVAFFDTPGNDVFTASPTHAQLDGPVGSNILYIAAADPDNPTFQWDTVRALLYKPQHGYDKAYLTGSDGNDTLRAIGMPHSPQGLPSGMTAGSARLTGAGYSLQVDAFNEVYVDLKTGTDTAYLYDSTSNQGTDTFWGNLHDAVLSDGSVDLNNGNLLTPANYYFRVTGFDNSLTDRVYLYGSPATKSSPNQKKVINPLDYVLAVSGPWLDAP